MSFQETDQVSFSQFMDGAIRCNRCGEDYMHHDSVHVGLRRREDDDDGEIVAVGTADDLRVSSGHRLPGRRDSVLIAFWCEQCDFPGPDEDPKPGAYLMIQQHKGCTYLSWADSDDRKAFGV